MAVQECNHAETLNQEVELSSTTQPPTPYAEPPQSHQGTTMPAKTEHMAVVQACPAQHPQLV